MSESGPSRSGGELVARWQSQRAAALRNLETDPTGEWAWRWRMRLREYDFLLRRYASGVRASATAAPPPVAAPPAGTDDTTEPSVPIGQPEGTLPADQLTDRRRVRTRLGRILHDRHGVGKTVTERAAGEVEREKRARARRNRVTVVFVDAIGLLMATSLALVIATVLMEVAAIGFEFARAGDPLIAEAHLLETARRWSLPLLGAGAGCLMTGLLLVVLRDSVRPRRDRPHAPSTNAGATHDPPRRRAG